MHCRSYLDPNASLFFVGDEMNVCLLSWEFDWMDYLDPLNLLIGFLEFPKVNFDGSFYASFLKIFLWVDSLYSIGGVYVSWVKSTRNELNGCMLDFLSLIWISNFLQFTFGCAFFFVGHLLKIAFGLFLSIQGDWLQRKHKWALNCYWMGKGFYGALISFTMCNRCPLSKPFEPSYTGHSLDISTLLILN